MGMGFVRRIILVIMFVFLSYSLVKNVTEFRKNLLFYNNYQKELEDYKKEHALLLTEKTLATSPRELEKTIRNKLNLLKEGEIAVIVPPPSPTPTPVITPYVPVYKQWWNVFFLSR